MAKEMILQARICIVCTESDLRHIFGAVKLQMRQALCVSYAAGDPNAKRRPSGSTFPFGFAQGNKQMLVGSG